jgi:16S rRNA (adenine1518-N6/adenine1519-N6)-dimethyltransferase
MQWLLDVPPEAFDPPPRVDSAVVWMRPLAEPLVDRSATLSELVTASFSQRRKLLRHTLGRWLDARGHQTRFDLQRRAEEVPVSEYASLAREIDARR